MILQMIRGDCLGSKLRREKSTEPQALQHLEKSRGSSRENQEGVANEAGGRARVQEISRTWERKDVMKKEFQLYLLSEFFWEVR